MDECARNRQVLAGEFVSLKKVFTALGDETRQHIFITLLEDEQIGMRVPQITELTHLSRPAVSHHLAVLKDAGLVAMHRDGRCNYYYVDANADVWKAFVKLANDIGVVVAEAGSHGYPRLEDEWDR